MSLSINVYMNICFVSFKSIDLLRNQMNLLKYTNCISHEYMNLFHSSETLLCSFNQTTLYHHNVNLKTIPVTCNILSLDGNAVIDLGNIFQSLSDRTSIDEADGLYFTCMVLHESIVYTSKGLSAILTR